MIALAASAFGAEMDALVADRAAIERVYHDRRTGTKPPFEEAMPGSLIRRHVETDERKAAVLQRMYGVEVSAEMIAAEVRRIDATTRAPEMLAELKRALGGDKERFARSMARPIIVERELRSRFDNDARLHASQRARADEARAQFLAGAKVPGANPVTWQLGPRPAVTPPPQPAGPVSGRNSSGAYTNEATVQISVPLAAPASAHGEERLYFEDIEPELRGVLRAQLRKAGDVSALVESSGAFVVFRATEVTERTISAEVVSISKRNFEQWLAEQP